MPRHAHPLSDLQVRNARPREASYKLVDGGGLYIEISPNGSKLWKMKHQRPGGREGKLSFGPYPDVSLVNAREKRAEARRLIADDIDPGEVRDEARRSQRDAGGSTFEAVAREWHETMRDQWQPQTAQNILHRLATDIFPYIGRQHLKTRLSTNRTAPPVILGNFASSAETPISDDAGFSVFRCWGISPSVQLMTPIQFIDLIRPDARS